MSLYSKESAAMRPIDHQTHRVSLQKLQGSLTVIGGSSDRPGTLWRILRKYSALLIFVLVPSFVTTLYFTFFASNVFVSESKFVVRSPTDVGVSAQITGLTQSFGVSKSADDAYAINEFLGSYDALQYLEERIDLGMVYGSSVADFLSRYPGVLTPRSKHGLYKFYRSMTKVHYDKTTGISTLLVYAFRPEDAQEISKLLLDGGEILVNRLSARIHKDVLARANDEIDRVRGLALAAQAKISDWRNREQQLDPSRFSASLIEVVARLSLELVMLRSQALDLEKNAPKSPSLASLNGRIVALSAQIEQTKQSLAGTHSSMAAKITEFEQLQLEKEFAEKIYAARVASAEAARADAIRQTVYLDRIVEPNLPDQPVWPLRLILSVGSFIGSLVLFLFLSRVAKNLFRHSRFNSASKGNSQLVRSR